MFGSFTEPFNCVKCERQQNWVELTRCGSGPGGVLGPTSLFGDELCVNSFRWESPVNGELSAASEGSASFDFEPRSLPGVLSADATFFFFDFLTRVGGGVPSPSLRAARFAVLTFFTFVFVERVWWCWFVDDVYRHIAQCIMLTQFVIQPQTVLIGDSPSIFFKSRLKLFRSFNHTFAEHRSDLPPAPQRLWPYGAIEDLGQSSLSPSGRVSMILQT